MRLFGRAKMYLEEEAEEDEKRKRKGVNGGGRGEGAWTQRGWT